LSISAFKIIYHIHLKSLPPTEVSQKKTTCIHFQPFHNLKSIPRNLPVDLGLAFILGGIDGGTNFWNIVGGILFVFVFLITFTLGYL
jgi:hypothetical protein